MEGVPEPEASVVQVMADLVQQRPEIRPECYHPLLLRGAHPELDARRPAALVRVEAVQLAPSRVRPRGKHVHPDRRQRHRVTEAGDQRLARPLDGLALLGPERGRERLHQGLELGRALQPDLGERVALPVDCLLAAREPRVVRERQRARCP